MLGEIQPLADGLWLVVGEMPADNFRRPDVANALVYRAGDRLYLLDSGAGPVVRGSLERLLREAGPVRSFVLLNSHAHVDHNGNNDLIHAADAAETHHYIAEAGLSMLDPPSYFARQFAELSDYYDFTTGFRTHRLMTWSMGVARDLMAAAVGEQRALAKLMPVVLRTFAPIHTSPDTARPYESLPRRRLDVGGVQWTGWVFGNDDVWVLESRGHTADHVLFYLPAHQLLHTADETFPLFPTFPESDGRAVRATLQKCQAMTRAGAVRLLTDGHDHRVFRGTDEICALFDMLLADHSRFEAVLAEILEARDGLTVGEIYAQVCRRRTDPAVAHFLALEFPHTPITLRNVIALTLHELGYEARGRHRRKRFYRPATAPRARGPGGLSRRENGIAMQSSTT